MQRWVDLCISCGAFAADGGTLQLLLVHCSGWGASLQWVVLYCSGWCFSANVKRVYVVNTVVTV